MGTAARALRAAWVLAAILAWAALPMLAAAASPSPSPLLGADTRSAGQGPGFVGSPGAAILLVLAIGAVAVVATLAYVRASGGSGHPDR